MERWRAGENDSAGAAERRAAWRDSVDPTIVATGYRVQAKTRMKGIVLMHDHTVDDPVIAKTNRSAELTCALVPLLIGDGFPLVSLRAVPIH